MSTPQHPKSEDQPGTETHTEKAVRELKEAAEQVKATRAECWREAENNDEVENQPHNLDHVLTALNMIEDQQYLDPESDFETPRTWEEAKNSPDGFRWEQLYREELTSLKEMGV
ncbi:hypothetical protein C0995_003652 [Termitomyces sp. Mi166|nr:hypothetical protein C0995_003652 [Termitomyces sp. Mi166\